LTIKIGSGFVTGLKALADDYGRIRLKPDGIKIGKARSLICHARVLLSGIQAADRRCVPVKLLDSRRLHAGMT